MAATKKKKTAKRKTTAKKVKKASARRASSRVEDASLPKKLAIAGGGYCLYAPRFPRFLDRPGFPDEANISSALVPSVFFLSFLDGTRPLRTTCAGYALEDGKAVLTHKAETAAGGSIVVTEYRFVTADDRFVSELTIVNEGKEDVEFSVVLWTTTDPEGEPVSRDRCVRQYSLRLRDPQFRSAAPPHHG